MKTTLRIARLELNTLFYSPIAWILSIVFLFQCGLIYTNNLRDILVEQDIGGSFLDALKLLTSTIMVGPPGGLFMSVLSKLYLYLPLLTMGLISREVSSGTIKLLYSSPIKVRQIILGKFCAMMTYNLLLILILSIFVTMSFFNIKSTDMGLLFSGLLGIYLLLGAYTAIGLFMSCLTSYQIVAAICTLAVFAVLNYIGQIWQGVDFVRDLTYFLSLNGRIDHMLNGLITTKDVFYFLVIIAMFLVFSIIRLQSGRESLSALKIAGRYIAVFFVALAIGYVSAIPLFIGYCDATADKLNTLTPNAQKAISQIGDEPLEVTYYFNLLDHMYQIGAPSQRNRINAIWDPYLRFKPNIKFNFVYYYNVSHDSHVFTMKDFPGQTLKQQAQKNADARGEELSDFKTPEEIKKIIDLEPEKNRCVMRLKYKGKITFLRFFDDPHIIPDETEVIAAIKRLTGPVPKIAFVQGEFERSIERLGPRDFGAMVANIEERTTLVNQGFDCETLALKDHEIPQGLSALVIGDPRTNFTPDELIKIQKYIDDGGNLIITSEPAKQDIINPIIQPLGVQVMDGMLVQKTKNFPPNMVEALLTKFASGLSGGLKKPFKDSIGVSTPGVAGLSYDPKGPFTIKPLLVTNSIDTWNKKGVVVLDSAEIAFSAANGDDHSPIPVALALERKINGKQQRIIVTGDADLLTTAALDRGHGRVQNPTFNSQMFRWFTYGQFPIDASRPIGKDNRVTINRAGVKVLKIIFLWILPALLAVFAIVFLIRRKRK